MPEDERPLFSGPADVHTLLARIEYLREPSMNVNIQVSVCIPPNLVFPYH